MSSHKNYNFSEWDDDKKKFVDELDAEETIIEFTKYINKKIKLNIHTIRGLVNNDFSSNNDFLKLCIDNNFNLLKINNCTLIDITELDVSHITDFSYLFYGVEDFNQDISGWDVSNGEKFISVFSMCEEFNQDISGWDMSKAEDIESIFEDARSFNQPLSGSGENKGWDVSNVTSMAWAFSGAHSFNQPLSDWDVSKVKIMGGMFYCAYDFNQPLSDWNINNVVDMDSMFVSTNAFVQYLGNWKLKDNVKPFINGKSFNHHNTLYQFTKDQLLYLMNKYKSNPGESKEKYDLMKYIKQFREFDLDEFNSIINELKTKSNSGKEFFDEIS
jgi:hypothetical protein